MGYEGGNLNLYGYCSNNSINRTDPMGLCDNPSIVKLIERMLAAIKKYDYDRAYEYAEKIALATGNYDIKASLAKTTPFEKMAPFPWWDLTSRLFPNTNYLGWRKSGPGPVKSNLDLYGLIHDKLLERTGASAVQFLNRDVMTAHVIFVSLWYHDYQERKKE